MGKGCVAVCYVVYSYLNAFPNMLFYPTQRLVEETECMAAGWAKWDSHKVLGHVFNPRNELHLLF